MSISRTKSFTFSDQIIVTGSNFSLFVILSRILTKADLADFVILWTIMLLIQSFQIGIVLTPMLSLSKKQSKLSTKLNYYFSTFKLQILFSIISIIILLFIGIISFYTEIKIDAILIVKFIPTILLFQICEFIRKFYYSNQLFKKVLIYDFIRLSIQNFSLLVILFSTNNQSNLNVIFLLLNISFIGSFIYSYFSEGEFLKYFSLNKLFKYQIDLEHIKLSKALIPSAFMQWTGGGLYSLLALTLLGSEALLALRIVQNIVGLGNILFQIIDNLFITKLSLIYNDLKLNYLYYLNYANKLLISVFLLFLSIYITIFLFSKSILEIIYGYEYINYSWLLKVLSIIYILNSLSICIKCFSISLKEIKIINLVYFVTNASSVLLGYFLIDRYKLYGAGIGLLLTQTLNTSIYFYWWILKNKNFNSNKLNTNS